MNISDVNIRLTSEDIKSIIDDFLHIPGLNITDIKVDKHISIIGSFKKFVTIPFMIEVGIDRVQKHNILLMLKRVEIVKVPIFKWIRNIAIRKIISLLKEFGLSYNEGAVDMHLPTLMKRLPIKLEFSLQSVQLSKDTIQVDFNRILLKIGGPKEETKSDDSCQHLKITGMGTKAASMDDAYAKIRNKIDKSAPDSYKEILSYIMIMPDIAALFVRLFRDKRVPLKVKIMCGSVIAYFALPIDILPDFIPIIGSIDDFALAFYALNKILCEVPEEVITDNWQGKDDIILIIRTGISLIQKFVGASNLAKGYRWILKNLKKGNNKDIHVEVKEKEIDVKESICD